MPFVIQLFFEAASAERIRDVQSFAAGSTTILDGGRPHISVASCAEIDIDLCLGALREIAGTTLAFSVVFTGVGSFLSLEGVVYLAPAPSDALLAVQRRSMEVVRGVGVGINPYYAGDIWTPHCTIVSGLDLDARLNAIRSCATSFQEFEAPIRTIGLIEYGAGQGRTLGEFDLGGIRAIVGLHHVQITIPKGAEERAREFYRGVLELPEVEKPASLAGRGGFWMQVGDRQVHVGTEDDFDRTLTKAHLAYRVTGLSRWRSLLEGQGIEILDGVPIPGYDRFEFRDPFGNRVEMIESHQVS